ncbi:D-lactate dehydrogenase [Aureimonas ureilytica]|uniref:D-lactate dehydrogenase n=1 Tax=Aureimonas ureilytica TaxID=401562 RepID=UPI000363201C|nr:D-lactate dehydrogenase [Aureimonas ureilytica]
MSIQAHYEPSSGLHRKSAAPAGKQPCDSTLVAALESIVGREHVLTANRGASGFTKGYRHGQGEALAVVRPGTLLELWKVFKASIEANAIVIMQAANTGLTGGSTPDGEDYDRDVVLINTMRIDRIDILDAGRQVLCLPGSTLYELQEKIAPFGRTPHSVIGSTSIGASVIGGICNNSGGALLKRGPAYTQLALFAGVEADGTVRLVNHLGIELGSDPEEILGRLDRGEYSKSDVGIPNGRLASDKDYGEVIRNINAPTPARYNNDPRLLHEVSGSAGKLCVFAVRLDTFPMDGATKTFYIGSNDHTELTQLRRHMLADFASIPVTAEYVNRDTYRSTEFYGKDLFLLLKYGGTHRVRSALKMKTAFDAICARAGFSQSISDHLLQFLVRLLPNHLPKRMNAFRDKYEHHIMLRMEGNGIEEARAYLEARFPSASGNYFECTEKEASDVFRHRYAVGGANVRYRAVHRQSVEDILAFDLALPRNTLDWRESIPAELERQIEKKMICGHFFCQVFHYDYAIKRGVDLKAFEQRMIDHVSSMGIEYPSEHNVGHSYRAKPQLEAFYRNLDPTNSMNPGIGRTTKKKNWDQ